MQIDDFKIGEIQGRLSSDLKSLVSDKLKFSNNAGKVELRKLNISLQPPAKTPAPPIHVEKLENPATAGKPQRAQRPHPYSGEGRGGLPRGLERAPRTQLPG
ncbi:MAG: hypothetical protein HC902_09095 [Calothrix sp. SM1_5_4]|nr:hypothetical protein [Calothrix sp. SM1_5_4]